jgi:hypothetical protein
MQKKRSKQESTPRRWCHKSAGDRVAVLIGPRINCFLTSIVLSLILHPSGFWCCSPTRRFSDIPQLSSGLSNRRSESGVVSLLTSTLHRVQVGRGKPLPLITMSNFETCSINLAPAPETPYSTTESAHKLLKCCEIPAVEPKITKSKTVGAVNPAAVSANT